MIEKVPVITCPHCGESYLTAATLHQSEPFKSFKPRNMRQSLPLCEEFNDTVPSPLRGSMLCSGSACLALRRPPLTGSVAMPSFSYS
ncbi:MAG TPA: YgiT-type zinc finger protein [Candidatus Binatia bacterium]|nr:YgiT-type zinc finger protein [Candidatus Binatia bacterium]